MNRKKLRDLLLITAGTFILAVSVEYFIIPFNILSGGVAGIAVALEPIFHIDETLFANVTMLILLIVGRFFLGREFMKNTIISSLLYPVFTTLLSKYPVEIAIDPVLAAFYSGLLGGAGISLVIRTGSSTGGMDIPPLILHKLTGVKISTLVMITDALTVLLGIIAYDVAAALIGLISVFSSGYAIDKVLSFGTGVDSKSVQIVSKEWETIKCRINKELDRGVTILEGKGGYTGEHRPVVLCVVSAKQYNHLLDIINEVDSRAFVITTDASDMHGEGFTYSSPNI
ncbi:MAG: YitT family protein [Solobacterium sp.]|nr:YitT family protein [Solobacterium sp.]